MRKYLIPAALLITAAVPARLALAADAPPPAPPPPADEAGASVSRTWGDLEAARMNFANSMRVLMSGRADLLAENARLREKCGEPCREAPASAPARSTKK